MKIQTLASMVSSTCVLWCFLPMAVYGCSIHDQLCTFHALGAPHTSYDVKNASTSLNIYAQAENPSAGAARTDFDNNVLLPTNTAISDAISPSVIRPTGPYTAAQTSYLQNGHLPAIWSDSSTLPVHVYPSQYQVTFNQNTAQANHTGDLNGGENGNIPNAMGCPSRESNPDCEAVVITGNVPSGIYSQKIEMFNFYNVSNPSAVMTVGAYATGQGVLIQQSHVDDATAQLGGLPRQLVDLQTTNGKPSNVTSAVNSSFYLAGSKATSQQFDYHFYNRGFDSHAQGTLSFDQKMYHNRGMSQAYQVANHQTGNLDIYRSSLYSIDTKTTTIGAQGGSVVSVRNGGVRAGQAQLVGVQRLQPPTILDNGLCYVDDRFNTSIGKADQSGLGDLSRFKDFSELNDAIENSQLFQKVGLHGGVGVSKLQAINILDNKIGQWGIEKIVSLTPENLEDSKVFKSPTSKINIQIASDFDALNVLDKLDNKVLTPLGVIDYQVGMLSKNEITAANVGKITVINVTGEVGAKVVEGYSAAGGAWAGAAVGCAFTTIGCPIGATVGGVIGGVAGFVAAEGVPFVDENSVWGKGVKGVGQDKAAEALGLNK